MIKDADPHAHRIPPRGVGVADNNSLPLTCAVSLASWTYARSIDTGERLDDLEQG